MSDVEVETLIGVVAVLVFTVLLIVYSLLRKNRVPRTHRWRVGVFAEHDRVADDEEEGP